MNIQGIEIEWLGHASFIINNNIFIDPYEVNTDKKADLILITHPHYDHCSILDIQKIIKKGTIIIAPPDCTSKLSKLEEVQLKLIEPGKKFTSENLIVEAIPAYNIDKEFHPKQNQWVGYIITLNGKRIYFAGDTDLIPEMNNLNVDIAMLPIGGKYTMDYEEAAKAVSKIKTKVVVPMHFGKIVGHKEDADEFKKLVKDAEVIIL